jgi:enoyl-CoA hydratase/carnithine racemase
VRATLENGRLALAQGWRAAYANIAATQQRLYNSEDAAEGVRSFAEKRDARFVGR